MTTQLSPAELEKEIQNIASHFLFEYRVTNESLDAVVEGLELTPNDSVLAIAGSGDQAFAILEYAGRVTAVDKNSHQTEYVKLRAEALKQGRYDLFLCNHARVPKVLNYFSKEGRLDRIKANLENLTILEPSDIFALKTEETFSKIYLSNALCSVDVDKRRAKLFDMRNIMFSDGLIYVANSYEYVYTDKASKRWFGLSILRKILSASGLIYLSRDYTRLMNCVLSGFEENSELTQKARLQEYNLNFSNWLPVVYRKVESAK
jgi:hypothetical protein